MAKLSSVKFDPRKSDGGVWVDYEAGIRLLIARMGNPAFDAFIRSKQRPRIRGFRAGKISDAETEALTREAVAKHVLIGWENIEDDDDKPLHYTPEKAFEILSNPAYADLYQFVLVQASDVAAYRAEAEDEAAKN